MKMKESFRKNKIGIALILVSALLSCIGQFLWKLSGMQSLVLIFFGFVSYGLGMLVMLLAYRHGSLSVLHPIQSVGYVFAIFLAYFALPNETISPLRIVGIFVILAGVCLIGGGDD